MSVLLRLYPAAWRSRYGSEFEALLAERPPSTRDLLDIVAGAIDARLSPQLESAPVVRRPRLMDRLAGGAAIAGGLVWSATYLVGWLIQAEGDLSLPVLLALALMLLSLPGRYVARYARPVVLGAGASAVSVAVILADLLPWDLVAVPALTILLTLGPGALALAAARAGVGARDRWRLVLLTMPWPIVGVVAVLAGIAPAIIPIPLVIASFLPIGIAWVALGLRIARGRPVTSIITTGGAA